MIKSLIQVSLFWSIIACHWGCQEEKNLYNSFSGETMGTYYKIKGAFDQDLSIKKSVDSLLVVINEEVSTYIQNSTISKFNNSEGGIKISKGTAIHFEHNLMNSYEIYEQSAGDFDPTIGPVVNFWGFGHENKRAVEQMDSLRIKSLLEYVGLGKVTVAEEADSISFLKMDKEISLDFNSIAKGYAVDEVGVILENKGIKNYLVDIGGEVKGKGVNDSGQIWSLAISKPEIGASPNEIVEIIQLDNLSMATSGNYRNFYEVNGQKYGHTIDPKTGFPTSNILSATIIHSECQYADALATACMVKGWPESKSFIESIKDAEGYFVYLNKDQEMEMSYTAGIKKYIKE